MQTWFKFYDNLLLRTAIGKLVKQFAIEELSISRCEVLESSDEELGVYWFGSVTMIDGTHTARIRSTIAECGGILRSTF